MVRRAQKFMRYTVVVAVILTLSGKFLGFIKDVVLASFFGAGVRTDAYFIANLIPGLVWLAILTTISAAFLPQYVKLKQAGEGEEIAFTQQAVRLYCYLHRLCRDTKCPAASARTFLVASCCSSDQ